MRIQVYTAIDPDEGKCLIVTDGTYGWYLHNGLQLDSKYFIDAVAEVAFKRAWTLTDQKLIDLVYELTPETHPEYFI